MLPRRLVALASALCLTVTSVLLPADPAWAQRKRAQPPVEGPAMHQSRNFVLRTDLPQDEAQELLKKLETMLKLISTYWARPNGRPIEIYVVQDLSQWPAGAIDPRALPSLQDGAGITLSETTSLQNTLTGASRVIAAKAVAYAVPDRGTPLHEAVHAYCAQAFGTTGPVWYSEGMAEMGSYWRENDGSVNAEPGVVKYLRNAPPKDLDDIVNGVQFTGDSWQNYAWRWALCHLLANNTNYRDRFRPLGLDLLLQKPTSFDQVYGAMAKEIAFEYLFFLEHMEVGYRVDLCSWDWKSRYNRPRGAAPIAATIEAGRGWQPGRLLVEAGEEYEYAVTGQWKTGPDADADDADGDETGRGRLVGILFDDYELSEPFELGTYGSFTAPHDGNLLLRCQDGWHELADNSGKVSVRIKLKRLGNPLPNPKQAAAARP